MCACVCVCVRACARVCVYMLQIIRTVNKDGTLDYIDRDMLDSAGFSKEKVWCIPVLF